MIGPIWGKLRLFRIVLRLLGMKKIFELGQNFFKFFFIYEPYIYKPILVFPKFDPLTAPGMALCVNLGPKSLNLFPLVSE